MTALGQKKHSTAKDDIAKTSVVVWGEHIFFEKNGVVSAFGASI
jgi:hypothetical protein